MNSNNFFSLVPDFINGVHAMRRELIGAALVIAFAGLIIHVCAALVRKDIGHMAPALVRLALIPIIIGSLESWGDLLVGGVQGLISDMGMTGTGSNIFQDYQAAIARKLGTAAGAANAAQAPAQRGTPGQAVPSPLPDPNQTSVANAILTHYAYPGESTPDSKSGQGIGAFGFDSAPGSLIPMYSAALTASAAKAYNLTPGQSFTITSQGQTYNLMYADVAPESDNRIDIYDPDGTLAGGNNFSQTISSINGGAMVMGQSGIASMLPNPGGSIGDQVLWAITLGLSWVASAIMWLMQIAQQILYEIEIAISPVFVACLMVPALTHLAKRFFMILVGICLWPLAWAVCDLATKVLIDLAVNPSSNAGLGSANFASTASGPLAGLAYLIVIALWVIGSTLAAPVFIGILLAVGGGSATAAVFGATLGAAASRVAHSSAGAAAGAISGVGSNGRGYISPAASSRMNIAPNYAVRPIGKGQNE